MLRLLLLVVLLTLSGFSAWALLGYLTDPDPPVLPEFYWGPKGRAGQPEDTSVRPFLIQVDEKVLSDLRIRLELETSADGNRLLSPLEGIGFQYGFNTKFLKTVTSHWLNKYDWKAREKLLNIYPQFKTRISGIDVHFQHIKPAPEVSKRYKATRPLLLLHGWPNSFLEYRKIIPILLEPKDSDINFELIIPSLPGFGFSERAHRPGLGRVEMSQLFLKLMQRLGHGQQFYVHGGDWGAFIGTHMASMYPENVAGFHTTLCHSVHPKTTLRVLLASFFPSFFLDEAEIAKAYPFFSHMPTWLEESGYLHLHSTKPDTIGVSLSNSPSGLAACILEKFSSWTNLEWKDKEDGGLVPYFDLDELLDNIMVYWVTNSITSAIRMHAESFGPKAFAWNLDNVPVKVPTGCMSNPKDFWGYLGEFHLQDKFHQILSFTKPKTGGCFSAFEIPEVFSKDVVNFFNLVERNTTTRFPTDNI